MPSLVNQTVFRERACASNPPQMQPWYMHLFNGRLSKWWHSKFLSGQGQKCWLQHVLLQKLEQKVICLSQVLVLLLVSHLQQNVVHVMHAKEDAIDEPIREVFHSSNMAVQCVLTAFTGVHKRRCRQACHWSPCLALTASLGL